MSQMRPAAAVAAAAVASEDRSQLTGAAAAIHSDEPQRSPVENAAATAAAATTDSQPDSAAAAPYGHALVVGATGMLSASVGWIAARCSRVSALARTRESLETLGASLASSASASPAPSAVPCSFHPYAADWSNPARFREAVSQAIGQAGVPEVVLAWIHDDAAALGLAKQVSDAAVSAASAAAVTAAAAKAEGQGSTALPPAAAKAVSFFHVLSSSTADPTASPSLQEQRQPFEEMPMLEYHQVVLGFVDDGNDGGKGRSRWLTDEEISSGVIRAIEANSELHVVGTVQPWAHRP